MSETSFTPVNQLAASPGYAMRGEHKHLSSKRMGDAALLVITIVSGFVLIEPAPYELLLVCVIPLFFIFGLPIRRSILPLLLLGLLYISGGIVSAFTTPTPTQTLSYISTTFFMFLSAWFFALIVAETPLRLRIIIWGYLISACLTSIIGILGYFQLMPGADLFTLYGRASGGFKDPNVLGPFLLIPFSWLWLKVLTKNDGLNLLRAATISLISLAIFLSFSRASWAGLVFCALSILAIAMLNTRSLQERSRQILICMLAGLSALMLLLIVSQFEGIGALFSQRAQLVQDYDAGEFGRFQRHWAGFTWALSEPLGIGNLTFGAVYGEDPHNIWLKSLLVYGWIGFAAFAVLIGITLKRGFELLFYQRPWTTLLQTLYVAFLAHILIGWIIDINHWRHFYLILGLLWGIFGLEARHQAAQSKA